DSTNNDFGNFKLGTKAGHVLDDVNGDGSLADGTPLVGWTVSIYNDVDGSGTYNAGDTLGATTTTDATGKYSFGGLHAGKYLVIETCPSGWIQTYPSTAQTEATCGSALYAFTVSSGFNEKNGRAACRERGTIAVHDVDDDNDDGSIPDGTPRARGTESIYNDVDGSGTYNAGFMLGDTTTTDAPGKYILGGLHASKYLVIETCPSGWIQTYPSTAQTEATCGSALYAFTVSSGFNE